MQVATPTSAVYSHERADLTSLWVWFSCEVSPQEVYTPRSLAQYPGERRKINLYTIKQDICAYANSNNWKRNSVFRVDNERLHPRAQHKRCICCMQEQTPLVPQRCIDIYTCSIQSVIHLYEIQGMARARPSRYFCVRQHSSDTTKYLPSVICTRSYTFQQISRNYLDHSRSCYLRQFY